MTVFIPFPVSSDFGTKSSTLIFEECDTRHCVNITKKNDSIVVYVEVFGITRTRSPRLSNEIRLELVDGMDMIKDDDRNMVHVCKC